MPTPAQPIHSPEMRCDRRHDGLTAIDLNEDLRITNHDGVATRLEGTIRNIRGTKDAARDGPAFSSVPQRSWIIPHKMRSRSETHGQTGCSTARSTSRRLRTRRGRLVRWCSVQSSDGNTCAADPGLLGGGNTDTHLIDEGLSRVAVDAVLAGAETVRRSEVVFSVWHPKLVDLRMSLGLSRHPVQSLPPFAVSSSMIRCCSIFPTSPCSC